MGVERRRCSVARCLVVGNVVYVRVLLLWQRAFFVPSAKHGGDALVHALNT